MRRTLVPTALALLSAVAVAQDPPSCEAARVGVLPDADELLAETIPWRTTFRDAALEADAADRPILLWAMNGHPLGCT